MGLLATRPFRDMGVLEEVSVDESECKQTGRIP